MFIVPESMWWNRSCLINTECWNYHLLGVHFLILISISMASWSHLGQAQQKQAYQYLNVFKLMIKYISKAHSVHACNVFSVREIVKDAATFYKVTRALMIMRWADCMNVYMILTFSGWIQCKTLQIDNPLISYLFIFWMQQWVQIWFGHCCIQLGVMLMLKSSIDSLFYREHKWATELQLPRAKTSAAQHAALCRSVGPNLSMAAFYLLVVSKVNKIWFLIA